jgi:excisionase family DNA binding protein
MNRLLRVDDVAAVLSISRSQAYRLVARRMIPYVKMSGVPGDKSAVRIREEDIVDFIEQRRIR